MQFIDVQVCFGGPTCKITALSPDEMEIVWDCMRLYATPSESDGQFGVLKF